MAAKASTVVKVVALVFTPVGLLLLVLAGWSANRQYTIMKSWPTVEAEVIRSEVVRTEDSDGNVLYRPSIEFGYTVNGKEYQSFGGSHVSTSNYEATKRKLEAYHAGTRHRVWYNPADPNEIHFDVGYSFGFFFLPILLGSMGIVFTAFGAVFLIKMLSVTAQNGNAG